MSLQVVVDEGAASVLCGGLPPVVRGLHRAASELPGSRVVVDQGSLLPLDWPVQTEQARVDAGALKPGSPLLALAGDGFLERGEFASLARGAAPALGTWSGRVVAAYLPEAGELAFRSPSDSARFALRTQAPRVEVRWTPCEGLAQALAAEEALCSRLGKDTDGWISRLDRRLSIALSRRLLPLPVTPNAITTVSLILALVGCRQLGWGEYAGRLAGAGLLWLCCILDGCDGEVARLKLLATPEGAAYDLLVDHLTHVATFAAIVLTVQRSRPDLDVLMPGALLLCGLLGCMFTVWRLVLRAPPERRPPYAALVERLAGRDYVYLLAALVLLDKLEWFLWAAGAGSHVFYAALWAAELRLRTKTLPTA